MNLNNWAQCILKRSSICCKFNEKEGTLKVKNCDGFVYRIFIQIKRGNLMVANLDELLTPSIVSANDFVNTEYLQTLVTIIPKYVPTVKVGSPKHH